MNFNGSAQVIKIRRARINNLKAVNLDIKHGLFYVLTGPSGSGKSSLAFDVIYAEADRQGRASGIFRVFRKNNREYEVEGLPLKVVGIEQQILHQTIIKSVGAHTGFIKQVIGNSKKTCHRCKGSGYIRDVDINRLVKARDKPVTRGSFTPPVKALAGLDSRKWIKFCESMGVDPALPWNKLPQEVQEIVLSGGSKYFKGLVPAIRDFTKGTENIPKKLSQHVQEEIDFYIVNTVCPYCNAYGYIDMDRKLISPNETLGSLVDKKLIRLHKHELKILDELALRNIHLLHPLFKLSTTQARNLRFFTNILALDVPALIIFDEPVAGMLPWEAKKMASLLQELRSMGHTILAIEHLLDFIQKSDAIITFGPGAGAHGGKVVFQGTPTEYTQCRYYPGMHDDHAIVHSRITHANTNRKRFHNVRCSQRAKNHLKLYAKFHRWYDFVDLSLEIPLGKLVCVCGPSGSGKTAYIHAAFACCDKTSTGWQGRVDLANREGCDRLRRPYLITPEAIGKHAGSTPATYIGVWDRIRDLYAELPKAKKYRMKKSHFSFNTTVGRCPNCLGNGFLTKNHIRYIECPVCKGSRMNPKVKNVKYKGYHIGQINGLTIEEGIEVFDKHSSILNYLKFLSETALEYLVLGQPSNSLSGGEALRIKIATQLCRRLGDRSLYILDNPFRGIGTNAVPRLFTSLRGLVDKNNTVLIAENIREVACNCDWVIILDQPTVRGNKKRLNIIYKGLGNECPAEFWEHGVKRRNRS